MRYTALIAGLVLLASQTLAGPPARWHSALVAVAGNESPKEAASLAKAMERKLHGKLQPMPGNKAISRLGGPYPSPARDTSSVSDLVEKGVHSSYSFDHRQACNTLKQAIVALQHCPDSPLKWDLYRKAHIFLGRSLRGLGKQKRALVAFQKILRTRPDTQLGDEHSPKIRALWNKARKQIAKSKKTNLSITTTQQGATVYLDGVEVGQTPFESKLPRGTYHLRIQHPSIGTVERIIRLPGSSLSLSYDNLDAALDLSGPTPVVLARKGHVPRDSYPDLANRLGVGRIITVRKDRVEGKDYWIGSMFNIVRGRALSERKGWLARSSNLSLDASDLASYLAGNNSKRVRARPVLGSKAYKPGGGSQAQNAPDPTKGPQPK